MGRHNIQFKGLRHSPSDITGQDGDLLECVNLIYDNGELKPVEMPERMSVNGKLKNGLAVLVAVHNVTNGKKFVFALYDNGNTTISYKEENSNSEMTINTISGEQIQWAETIGNTLIIGTDKSTHYALYKNGAYEWLGDKLPQPVFEFDFKRSGAEETGYYISEWEPKTDTLTYSGDTLSGGGIAVSIYPGSLSGSVYDYYPQLRNTSQENIRIFRDGIKSHVEQAVGKMKKNNVFAFPFFIRYALRLFDGSYVMHSSPKLMLPSTLACPLLSVVSLLDDGSGGIAHQTDSGGYTNYVSNDVVKFYAAELRWRFAGWKDVDGVAVSNVGDFGDIIKGVDIFMSSQVPTYDFSTWDSNDYSVPKEFFPFYDKNGNLTNNGYGICYSQNEKIGWWDILTTADPNNTNKDEFNPALKLNYGNTQIYKNYKIELPLRKKGEVVDELENTSLFYRVKKYGLEELKSAWTNERGFGSEADSGILFRLETLPTLPDDYVSRFRMAGKVNYDYNQRLLLGNIRLQAPLWYQDFKKFSKDMVDYVIIDFIIEKPEKTICVEYRCDTGAEKLGKFDFGHYIYYPDPDCKKAIVTIYNGGARYIEIPMNEHDGLNGAYALMPDLKSLWESYSDFGSVATTDLPNPSSDYERYYGMRNTIAMSGVANPFHFPASNFKDIGRDKVIGIAANTLDVSSGQWGQYPLYVFCSDGIIAVMIDGEGKFGGIQAVSADVLREPIGLSRPTLVQTGQMLMFLTRRGVMAIAGTKIQCVSEAMEGRHFNTIRELPDAGQNVGSFVSFIRESSDNTDFRDYAASAFLAYDYAHNRVLVIRPDRDYQYVYALKTGMWSKEIIYTNLANLQVSDMHLNDDKGFGGVVKPLQVKPIGAAVNNYTEMYLQDSDSWLYRTMDVADENNTKQLYQYGYFVSRPIRFGTDEYKTITRLLHRYTHYAVGSNVRLALYGSRDGVRYGRINTLRGMSYQYFIFVIFTYLKPNERYSYVSVDFETRLTNKLR